MISRGIGGGVERRSVRGRIANCGGPLDMEAGCEGGARAIMIEFERAGRAGLEKCLEGVTSCPPCSVDYFLERGNKTRCSVVDVAATSPGVGLCPGDGGGGFGGVGDAV